MNPYRFPSTFGSSPDDAPLPPIFREYCGVWQATAEREAEPWTLVMAPRLPGPEGHAEFGGLSGFIASGELEGALFFPAGGLFNEDPTITTVAGTHYRADESLTQEGAEIELLTHPKRLRLSVPGNPAGPVELTYLGPCNLEALERIPAIGRRGLGFWELENKPSALAHAWFFGASILHFDVTVPHEGGVVEGSPFLRTPRVDKLTVYHPGRNRSTTRLTSVPAGYLSAADAFGRLQEFGLPSVVVDCRVEWIHDSGKRRQVLAQLRRLARAHSHPAGRRPVRVYLVGRSDDVSRLLCEPPERPEEGLDPAWVMDWAESADAEGLLAGCTMLPAALEFNLMRMDAAASLPRRMIRRLRSDNLVEASPMTQAAILRAGDTEEGWDEAVRAALDPARLGRHGEPGEIAVLTGVPHKLAHWLGICRLHLASEKLVAL